MHPEAADKERSNASTVKKVSVFFPALLSHGFDTIRRFVDQEEKLEQYDSIEPKYRPFFQRLLCGDVHLKCLVAADVSAASAHLKDLNMDERFVGQMRHGAFTLGNYCAPDVPSEDPAKRGCFKSDEKQPVKPHTPWTPRFPCRRQQM
eukprot:Selendium_serpulae@DN6453_c1_g1_i2.p1